MEAAPAHHALKIDVKRQSNGCSATLTLHQRGPNVYSLHAPEVECIGKGKAHRPYEVGVEVSVATTLAPACGGRFVTRAKTLPGNPMTATPSKP
ncbi:hypothetical protein ACVIHF_000552 [Bradyrhizobium sp. USDA 4506]